MSNERAVTVSRGQVEMRAGGGKEGKVERKGEKERKNVEMRAGKTRKEKQGKQCLGDRWK